MPQDTVKYDSLEARPLPKWLTDQRDGLNTYQPQKPEMKADSTLQISLISTGVVILLTVAILTVWMMRKSKKRK